MYEMTKDGFVLLTMGYTMPDNLGVRQRQVAVGRGGDHCSERTPH